VTSYQEILNARAYEVHRRFEIPVMVAALLVVPVVIIESQAIDAAVLEVVYWTNWLIWASFVAEYVTVAWLTDDKWAYTRKAWLDVFIIRWLVTGVARCLGVDQAAPTDTSRSATADPPLGMARRRPDPWRRGCEGHIP
jgi:hypothetical protein